MRDTEMFAPRPTKGTIKAGIRLITFDAVRKCRNTNCPCHEICPYQRDGKCLVELKYLDAVLKNLVKIPGNKMTQEFMDKVSLHLMPLFHQLIRFQIRAYGVEEVCYFTAQGAIRVHPIFAEIRKTISAIEAAQKSLGVDLEYHRALGLIKGTNGASRSRDPDAYGDPDYSEAMSGEMEEIKEEIAGAILPKGASGPPSPRRTDYKPRRVLRDDNDEDTGDYASELEEDGD